MHARFYAPDLKPGEPATLPPDESEHLIRVLRLRAGDTVAVFDGRGRQFLARIESTGRRNAVVMPEKPLAAAPEPSVPLTLAVGITKADRMESAVRDAAMLGVSVIQPVVTERTEITMAALARANRVARWQRIAVSSVKQCGRAVVPAVLEPASFAEYVRKEKADLRLMLVEPRAGETSALADLSAPESAALLIGPEGGWTAGEIAGARAAGFHVVTLGRRTLRADAVPVAAVAVLQFLWGDL